MKISTKILNYINASIKSRFTPSFLAFSVALFASQAFFSSAETINQEYIITNEGSSEVIYLTEAPTDGKLTGSLAITNGTESLYTEYYDVSAIYIDNVSETITFEDFALSIKSYGLASSIDYHDMYGITGGVISLKNSSITLEANAGMSSTYLYAITDSEVIDFDATSKVSLTNDAPGASQVYGMGGSHVQNFAGSVTVNSESDAIAVDISDTMSYGTQFAKTAIISATAVGDAMALTYRASNTASDSLAKFDGKFTATSTGSGQALAANIYSYDSASVGSISGTYIANAESDALALSVSNSVKVGAIDADLSINTTGTFYSSDVVGYIGAVGVIEVGTLSRESGFDSFSGTITAKGASNAVGMELHHAYNIPSTDSNESGLISGSISATTDDTYFLTRDKYGSIVENQDGFDRSTFHFKSTAAIRIIAESSIGPKSSIVQDVYTEASTLNFADGAKAEAWVGAEGSTKTYGDVIQFTVEKLILNADANAVVTLKGDITTDSQAYQGYDGGGGGGDVYVLPAPDTDSSQGRVLAYNEGNYNVSSDYWFVSQVDMGNSNTLNTGHVQLLDSTRFVGTETVNFHVNSMTDYSNIVVSAEEVLTVTELNTVNITLGAELMGTEDFEIHLIAGEISDGISTELLISLTDLVIGDGTEEGSLLDDLASIYIKYNGEKVFYTEGMSIIMDGSSTNLTIGRGDGAGIIPEPSTATLSLLALAGLVARRRRRQVV